MKSFKRNLFFQIVDSFILLIHISYGMSMLQVWFLDPFNIPFRLDLIVLTLLAYYYRFGDRFKLLNINNKPAVVLFLLTYVADIFQNIFTDSAGGAIVRIFTMFDMYLFMEYVYAVYDESRKKKLNGRNSVFISYEIFTVYNVVAVLLCAVLLYVGVLNPYSNQLAPNSLTMSHYVNKGTIHFFPGFLSLTEGGMRGLISFNVPVLTGLSHEPHVLFLLIGPAFFLLLQRFHQKVGVSVALYISFLVMLVIATSTTAIFSFVIVLVVEQIYGIVFPMGKSKYSNILILVLVAAIGFWMFSSDFGTALLDTTEMIESKTSVESDEGSLGHALTMLSYVVTPQSFFGQGNMPSGGWGFNLSKQNIGLLSSILDILFYIIMLYKAFVNVFSPNRNCHYLGLATLYFLLHILKMSIQEFGFPQLAFFVVMTVIMDKEKMKPVYEKKKF